MAANTDLLKALFGYKGLNPEVEQFQAGIGWIPLCHPIPTNPHSTVPHNPLFIAPVLLIPARL
jgi:hypothetical protein